MLQKDCRFKDLPEHLKQQLIQLHEKSQCPNIKTIDTGEIENFQKFVFSVNSLETNSLKNTIFEISNYIQNIKNEINPEILIKNVEEKLKEIENNVILYNNALEKPMFLEELKDVYCQLSGRFAEIKHKREANKLY